MALTLIQLIFCFAPLSLYLLIAEIDTQTITVLHLSIEQEVYNYHM